MLTLERILAFQELIYRYYREHGRALPWRETPNPYYILISEIMLQQTRVERVVGKYEQFIKRFPNFASLDVAPLYQVLEVWHGLGYNRRALALKKIAQIITDKFNGIFPRDRKELMALPGVGRATAAAICAFAFNEPVVFIETNVRSVFIHVFSRDKKNVKDEDIYALVEQTLDRSNPREWYYALMDYGVMLKKNYNNPSRKSAHHRQQTPFAGSNRQLRGMILKTLIKNPMISESELISKLNRNLNSVRKNIMQLEKEGFVQRSGDELTISSV